ncbi:MAG TPA: hypothetical protein VF044_10095 [Actinomycetota bacterium]
MLAAGILGIASPARALFHLAHISEVHTMLDGDVGAQYVEIEMELTAQNVVGDTVLHAWDCDGDSLGDLLVVPDDVANAGTGVKWIMATTDPIGGIAPDFVIPGADLPATCGQVCWGAPGIVPPDPGTWDHLDPANYVDCLAYGGYTGPTKTESGTPTPLAPTATFALARAADTNDNAADFAEDCPTPENNAGEVGGPAGECVAPTTTTTIATTTTTLGGSTTTTTLPPGTIGQPLAGTKLLLKTKPGKPEKSKLVLVAKDPSLSIGGGPGSAEDPVVQGGSVSIASGSPGGAFTATHTLGGQWKVLGKPEAGKGYKWKSRTSPVRLVLIKTGKLLKVKAAGADVGFDLDDDPDPVMIEVCTGARRYCLELGGDTTFKDGRKWVAKKAPAPGACP